MEFFSNFAPIVLCSNLFSKLFEIGEKLLKNPFSVLAVFKKRLKKQYFGAKYKLFCKRCSLRSQTFLSWFQTCWDTQYNSESQQVLVKEDKKLLSWHFWLNFLSKTCWDILYCFENQLNFHVIFQVLGNYDANTATIGLMILLCQLFFASLLILFVIQKAKKQVEYLSSNQSNNVLEVITVIK